MADNSEFFLSLSAMSAGAGIAALIFGAPVVSGAFVFTAIVFALLAMMSNP